MDTVIEKDDEVVLLEMDDGAYKYHPAKIVNESKICDGTSASAVSNDHWIVLGSNDKLATILAEYAKYVVAGTRVVVVDDDLDRDTLGDYDKLDML